MALDEPRPTCEPASRAFVADLLRCLPGLKWKAKTFAGDEWEDLRQQTMLKALENWRGYQPQPGVKFISWLFTIMRNEHVAAFRKRREVEDPDGVHAARMNSRPRQESIVHLGEVRDAMIKLPAFKREIIWGVASGFEYHELADYHGVAFGTIQSRLSRARGDLVELLE